MNDMICITVAHYRHLVYYPFMSVRMFDMLDAAWNGHQARAYVPRKEYNDMLSKYFDVVKN